MNRRCFTNTFGTPLRSVVDERMDRVWQRLLVKAKELVDPGPSNSITATFSWHQFTSLSRRFLYFA